MDLKKVKINNYCTYSGAQYPNLNVSYEVFGQDYNNAPVVIVIHALTGNSDVISEEKGWWNKLIGKNKTIDTDTFSVISFNIPGNGYDGTLIDNYKDFIAKDIARLFFEVLQKLEIQQIYAAIGGSLGGGIIWEMLCLYPTFIKNAIPIASDWKSTDWIIAQSHIQEQLIINSNELGIARKMAMMLYRTPLSFTKKFNRTKTKDQNEYNVSSWLNHHGKKLESRFHIKAYLLMNHLLSTIEVVNEETSFEEVISKIESTIIQISVRSDFLFPAKEIKDTKDILDKLNIKNYYHEIISDDGHDAFLIEQEQISKFLTNIFNTNK